MNRVGPLIARLAWLASALAVIAPFAAALLGLMLNCHLAAGYPVETGRPVCLWLGYDVQPALWTAFVIGGMALVPSISLFLIFTVLWALAGQAASQASGRLTSVERQQVFALIRRAQDDARAGRLAAAKAAFDECLQTGEALDVKDVGDASILREIAAKVRVLGDAFSQSATLADAQASYDVAVRCGRRLAAAGRESSADKQALALSLEQLGRTLQRQRDVAGARLAWEEELAVADSCAERSHEPSWKRLRAVVHTLLAELGETDAPDHWRRAFELLSDLERKGQLATLDKPLMERSRVSAN